MDFVEYSDVDMMLISLARQLSRDLREALVRRDRVLFAVPGGNTPGPRFRTRSSTASRPNSGWACTVKMPS